MSEVSTKFKTGGQFLLEPITEAEIFSREDFSEDHKDIYNMVMDFDHDRIFALKEDLSKYNPELLKSLLTESAELGLLGMDIPEKYGGLELDKITTAIVAEGLVKDPSFAVTWSVQTGIGSLPLIWFGTDEQKEKYLPKIATGELICAYGLTEPSSGSDATEAKTTATLTDDGKHYILNGEKVFITNGGLAGLFTVFAQVDGNKFSAFLIESGTEGFTIGAEEKKLGMKGSSTTALIFQDAKVPVENLLYEVGKGATIAFNCLNIGRFKLGCSCLGGAKMVINAAAPYAKERKAFGTTISKLDAIMKKIGEMSVRTFATDSMVYRTIGLLQNEINALDKNDPKYYIKMGKAMEKFAIETSMVKVYCSDTSHDVIDEGLQIFGGYGFLEEYPIASAYRDDRINQIWEGTNEINRQIITGFMMKKALTEELPIRDGIRGIEEYMSNGELKLDDETLKNECQTVETAKRLALFIFNEALCQYGQDLRHEQQLTEILSDIFTEIFTAESTIVRAKKIMASKSKNPIVVDIAKVFTTEMVDRIMSKVQIANVAIFDEGESPLLDQKLSEFENRMRLKNNVIKLKRKIAQHVFDENKYPF
ncbi:MAG: acyl-CoA dehydrogenase family protein [Candidatus Neomarinimicrobiota bacterium]|jgi:alkylation response protein AidB-like acyl-CoA dehydrogenase|nr:acyl-CoA dehydrogenase family protein [Candidatus Neomarinimicrobiota bacterium]|tara:strand:- start:24015 stop:25796 length:1782 start_codon:yes stop_codon:yes gene_type:complete